MQYIVTAKEMKFQESYTIKKVGIPSLFLMERAALEMAEAISSNIYIKKETRIAIFAGTGNNGGDALALGRVLSSRGARVSFYLIGEEEKASTETKKQLSILNNLGFSILRKFQEAEYDIVIDGLFGIGLSREITGEGGEAVAQMNRLKEKGAYLIAVDIPSGVNADTGAIMGCCVQADMTVTFEYAKAGHYFYPGREKAGELFIRSIGLIPADDAFLKEGASYFSFGKNELKQHFPERPKEGNKGTFGKVLLVAGSETMGGAALLCGRGIFKTGAGMVKIITPKSNRSSLQGAMPEATFVTYGKLLEEEKIREAIAWADVIVAGPGLSKSENASRLMELLLEQGKLPMVIDADGLNLIAEKEALREAVKAYERGKIVMTPHPGEFARLAGISVEKYKKEPKKAIEKLAGELHCIVAGKDAVTLACSPDVKSVYMNLTGNDGMATAGCGDVLAGIIGGFLTRLAPFEAACVGICLHGMAGDKAAAEWGHNGMMASNLLRKIKYILA